MEQFPTQRNETTLRAFGFILPIWCHMSIETHASAELGIGLDLAIQTSFTQAQGVPLKRKTPRCSWGFFCFCCDVVDLCFLFFLGGDGTENGGNMFFLLHYFLRGMMVWDGKSEKCAWEWIKWWQKDRKVEICVRICFNTCCSTTVYTPEN